MVIAPEVEPLTSMALKLELALTAEPSGTVRIFVSKLCLPTMGLLNSMLSPESGITVPETLAALVKVSEFGVRVAVGAGILGRLNLRAKIFFFVEK